MRVLLGLALVVAGLAVVAGGLGAPSVVAGAASAGCDKFWAAPVSGNWGDASHWAPVGVPTNTDNVCIDAAGTYTVTASNYEAANSLTLGGAGASVTLSLDPAFGITISAPSTIESGSSLDVIPSGVGSYVNGHATLTNDGIITVPATGSFSFGTRGDLTFVNATDGSITDDGSVSVNGSFNDQGPVSIGAAGKWTVGENGPFIHAAGGTITNDGSFSAYGNTFLTFVQSGGSIRGNPLELQGTKIVDSRGTGPIDLKYNDVLTGTIPAGQTVTFPAGVFLGKATLTNDGTFECTGTSKGAGNLITEGTTIDNAGTFAVAAGSACDLEVPLTNTATGKVDIKGSLYPTYPVVNDGSFKLEEGGTFNDDIAGAGAIATFTNDPSGTVSNDGTFDIGSSTFTSNGDLGGSQPITLNNSSLHDQAGAGAFLLYGTDTVTGTVPAGQTLAVRGNAGYQGVLSLGGAVLTNDGIITLGGSLTNNPAWIVTGGSGGSLVDNGTIVLLAPPNGASASYDALDVPVTNASGGTILVRSPWAYLGDPTGYGSGVTLTNNGTLNFAAGAQLILEGGYGKPSRGSSIVIGVTGDFNVTVDGLTGAPAPIAAVVQGAYGPTGTVLLGGTFSITTLGAPHGTFSVVAGITLTGQFAGLQFGAHAYKVTTTGTSMSVTTAKPFTLTPENFGGTAGQSVHGTLAKLTGSSTAKYQVSVAWGDGKTSAGTFAPATGGGTVSGVHTYTSAGTYTVTTTVICSNGTTRTTSSTATIAA
jgi:hypothetical protein